MTPAGGQSDIDRVRVATDLVQLVGEHMPLRPRGREHVGLCPFHDDRTPSFAVVTHKGNAFFKCHACGAGGDAFDFVQQFHKMDFGQALRYLADRAGITLTRYRSEETAGKSYTRLREANAIAAKFFRSLLLRTDEVGKRGRALLERRGISDDTAEAFMIGISPDEWSGLVAHIRKQRREEDVFVAAGLLKRRANGAGTYDAFRNRLMFPICNELGQPIAFGGRALDPEDQPKYLNSAESPIFDKSKTLYGLHLARKAILASGEAIITEGYTDVIACHQAGIRNVVGTLGTALTSEHARILSRLCDTVVLVFDGDDAGHRAADRGTQVFFAEPVDVRICVLPDKLDPDDLLRQPEGAERFARLLESSEDALAYRANRFRSEFLAAAGFAARQKLLTRFLAELQQMGFDRLQGVRKTWMMTHLADLLGVSIDDLQASMPQPANRPAAAPKSTGQPLRTASSPPELLPEETEAMLPPPSAARRRAERELLAVLIYEPALRRQPIQLGEGEPESTVTRILNPQRFTDPECRPVAEAMWGFFAADQSFTVQQLRAALAHQAARSLVESLYFDGERCCDASSEAAAESLGEACRALLRCIERDEHRHRARQRRQSGSDLAALEEVLDFRRRHQHVAEAIPKGIRS